MTIKQRKKKRQKDKWFHFHAATCTGVGALEGLGGSSSKFLDMRFRACLWKHEVDTDSCGNTQVVHIGGAKTTSGQQEGSQLLSREETKGQFCKRAVLVNVPSFRFLVPSFRLIRYSSRGTSAKTTLWKSPFASPRLSGSLRRDHVVVARKSVVKNIWASRVLQIQALGCSHVLFSTAFSMGGAVQN